MAEDRVLNSEFGKEKRTISNSCAVRLDPYALNPLPSTLYLFVLAATSNKYPEARNQHPVSSIQHRVSSIQYRASSIQHPVSRGDEHDPGRKFDQIL